MAQMDTYMIDLKAPVFPHVALKLETFKPELCYVMES